MPEGARRPRVGILISGRGSNMAALLDAMRDGRVEADPSVVIANVPGAAGLARAAAAGVPTAVVDHRAVTPREAHERAMIEVLERHGTDIVCLAGFMRRLTPLLIGRYRGRVLNIHPALLPAFPGLDAQRAALDHGVKITGCTVHIVDELVDHGPIVLQAAVPVLEGDTAESLSGRILEQEHLLYPRALALVASGRIVLDGRRVRLA
ncbi:MAG TPA: phosphoribosylglycinamide formyltransferase [Candidatus Polarisedimenticolaceae bacterium]|nr:phosphoribosylglycinamide formyltransferase [Candidatus Polarisedimenticolaceae bacterium]